MLPWAEFEQAAPELAALGRERIEAFGFVFLGTVRKDGGPRVNPVEAHFVEGQLTLTMIWRSLKAPDLLRDPRAYLHTPILEPSLGRPGEFKLRASAVAVEERALRAAVADTIERASGWRPPERWHVFAAEVESAAFHDYDEASGLHHVRTWTPGKGVRAFTRRLL